MIDLHILSLNEALLHIPTKPTYAIRIASTDYGYADEPLIRSPQYRVIKEHTFDDNDTVSFPIACGPTWLSKEQATTILIDFIEHMDSIGSLLVHCSRGKNRSPAAAIAINEICNLGHDTNELKQRFSEYNMYVYNTLMSVR